MFIKAKADSVKGKGRKRKASGSTPDIRKALTNLSATPKTPQTADDEGGDEKMSRSGRVIKPKKFGDEVSQATTPSKVDLTYLCDVYSLRKVDHSHVA